jgi:Transposase, Mutator family
VRLAPSADLGGRPGGARLAVELANRENRSSWREFLLGRRERGLSGVEFVVSDDHAGLRQAIVEVLPKAVATLLPALPAQRAQLSAARGRRRLPARAPVT